MFVPQIAGGSLPVLPVASNLSRQAPVFGTVYPVRVLKSSLRERFEIVQNKRSKEEQIIENSTYVYN